MLGTPPQIVPILYHLTAPVKPCVLQETHTMHDWAVLGNTGKGVARLVIVERRFWKDASFLHRPSWLFVVCVHH